jgi:hypothetical protein
VYPQAPANSALLSISLSTGFENILRYLLFDVVLNWSLALLALALQNEEFPHSNRLFVAIADKRFRTPLATFVRIFRSSETHLKRFWLY